MIVILKSAQFTCDEWLYTVIAVKIAFDAYPNLKTKLNYLIKSIERKVKKDSIRVTNIS